jgi:hypothetical protein
MIYFGNLNPIFKPRKNDDKINSEVDDSGDIG